MDRCRPVEEAERCLVVGGKDEAAGRGAGDGEEGGGQEKQKAMS